jgi:hypothetical protein
MKTLAESHLQYDPVTTFRKQLMTDACWRSFFSLEETKERRLKDIDFILILILFSMSIKKVLYMG